MAASDADLRPDGYGERWADAYDEEHAHLIPPEEQLSLLTELSGGGRALELGLGTGRVALALAARGVDVHGVEASPAMVARLRSKPGGQSIPVTIGDMARLDVEGSFRLVYVVFNTLFVLLTQAAQVSCFKGVSTLLEPGGAFCLECFVPDLGRFDRGQTLRTTSTSDDEVRIEASQHDPVAQRVSTQLIRISSDSTSVRPIRLRYAWPSEMDLRCESHFATSLGPRGGAGA